MKPKGKSLNLSPRYRDFVNGRDQALEAILAKYMRAMSITVDALRIRTEQIVSHRISTRGGTASHLKSDPSVLKQLEVIFQGAAIDMNYLYGRMRKTVYTLSHAGEAEAMGRALGKEQKVKLSGPAIAHAVSGPTPSGGSISDRIDLALHRLKSKVIAAIKMSAMLDENPEDAIQRIRKAFPKKGSAGRRTLTRVKRLKEAAAPKGAVTFSTGVIDPATWQDTLQDYFDDVGSEGDVKFTERYEWELEQEMTQDFVEQVRSGQQDAAKENGISDFMWIAVIDRDTDECCASRDGLSSAEIEAQLNHGDLDADECDAVVPPGHFNCRCTCAPISNDLPEESPPDFGSFDDWLEAKAAA